MNESFNTLADNEVLTVHGESMRAHPSWTEQDG